MSKKDKECSKYIKVSVYRSDPIGSSLTVSELRLNEKGLFVVRPAEDGTPIEHQILACAFEKIEIIEDYFSDITNYPLTYRFIVRVYDSPMLYEGDLVGFIDFLRAHGCVVSPGVTNNRLLAYLSMILKKLEESGELQIKKRIPEGFILHKKKYISDGTQAPKPLTKKEREKLFEFITMSFNGFLLAPGNPKTLEKKLLVLLWSSIAPLHFTAKLHGKRLWLPHLLLYGEPRTGKTTLAEVCLYMWNPEHVYPGTSANTQPRLGELLQKTTYPILINEATPVLHNEALFDMIKHSTEGLTSRGKLLKGGEQQRFFLASAPIIFTANSFDPKDHAIFRRIFAIPFTRKDRIPKAYDKFFDESWFPWIQKRMHLFGKAFKYYIWKIYRERREHIFDKPWYDIAKELWSMLFEDIKMEKMENKLLEKILTIDPKNIVLSVDEMDRIMTFISDIVGFIRDTYFSLYKKSDAGISTEDMFRTLIQDNNLYPYIIYRKRADDVIITKEIKQVTSSIVSLQDLSDMFDWEYKLFKVLGKPQRCVRVSVSEFINRLLNGGEVSEYGKSEDTV